MDVIIKTIPEFDRRVKRLAKKYRSLKTDLQQLITILRQEPTHGTELGEGVFKIRIAIAYSTHYLR